jgi:hypothetical protein
MATIRIEIKGYEGLPETVFLVTVHSSSQKAPLSNGSYDGFVGLAMSAIIDAQIKTGALRFDTGQYQRPAAFGAGRPKVVDKLKIKRVYHGTDQPAPLRSK